MREQTEEKKKQTNKKGTSEQRTFKSFKEKVHAGNSN